MSIEQRTVRTTDGLDLAVYEQGRDTADTGAPTLVLVHGYPDNHTVWDGVAHALEPDFHIVRYDVRGCGASEGPSTIGEYALPQLSADLRAVIEATSPGEPVHLAAHDWGSIQSWASVTDPAMRELLSSYTSISGPDLGMAAEWLRGVGDHPKAALKQLLASYYIFAFQLPMLPEWAVRSGLLGRLVAHSASLGVAPGKRMPHRIEQRDALSGLSLYRANMLGNLAAPKPQPTTVPVQVLAPTLDAHVTVPLQTQAPAPYCTDFHWRTVNGNHWVVAQKPEVIANRIREFVQYVDGGPLPADLAHAARKA